MNKPQDTNPLELYLTEIKRAAEAECYHAAIVMALSVPDVCVTIQSKEPRSGPLGYTSWCRQYLQDGTDDHFKAVYYKLRCGVSHNAFFTHRDIKHFGFDRVIFSTPKTNISVRNVVLSRPDEKVYVMDAITFINSMTDAAREWLDKNASHPNVKRHLGKIIHHRADELLPFIAGAGPVLA